MSGGIFMYETLEFYDSNGYDLKEVLKSCIYKYYIINKNLKINSVKTFKSDKKNTIINLTNEVKVLSSERI